jgi:hypothetical protein
MAFDPPPYPDTLKRQHWDSNKSIMAKMKGYTGIGDALDDLDAKYRKVKWKEVFDFKARYGAFNQYAQNGFSIGALAAAVKAALAEVQSGDCSKLRAAAFELRKLAETTARDYAKSAVVPKKTTQLCRDIATEADQLGVAVNVNTMSPKIEAARKEIMGPVDTTLTLLEKDYDRLIVAVEHGVVELVRHPSYDTWDGQHIMDLCRNLNQVIGNAAKMADFGCDIGGDATHFQKLFEDLNLYARKQVPFNKDAQTDEVKKHVAALIQMVKRAKALR